MLTIIVAIFVFSVLIIIHEAGHLFAAKKFGVKVEVFSLGFGKRLFGVEIGGTDYRVSIIPFGGYIKMLGDEPSEASGGEDELASKPAGHRFWIMASGAITNYIFAFLLFSMIFMIGVPTLSNEIGQVLKGYPAVTSGMEVGDKIISINGTKVVYWEDIVDTIRKDSSENSTLDFEIVRGDAIRNIEVKPQISSVTNIFGQTITRPMVGIAPRDKMLDVSYDPFRAVYYGGKKLLVLTGMTYKGIWLLLTGGMPVKASVSGPIGIANLMGQAARIGIVPLMIITAHVSMALAVFNLLPFPVLDGGHIIFLGLEKLRGKPLSVRVQDIITQAALILLIAFALFVSWQDVLKFTPLGGK
ncbi:MAG: RIP metalloprotease RseP [Candidatus Tantalella remota]|nr:RIP metalloprotease RseP [Candidatus Tantalella remota]